MQGDQKSPKVRIFFENTYYEIILYTYIIYYCAIFKFYKGASTVHIRLEDRRRPLLYMCSHNSLAQNSSSAPTSTSGFSPKYSPVLECHDVGSQDCHCLKKCQRCFFNSRILVLFLFPTCTIVRDHLRVKKNLKYIMVRRFGKMVSRTNYTNCNCTEESCSTD